MEVVDIKIGRRLKEARDKSGLNQTKFAEKTDINRTYLNVVEKGKQNPSFDFIYKISQNTNISINWLLHENGQMFLLPDDHYLNNLEVE